MDRVRAPGPRRTGAKSKPGPPEAPQAPGRAGGQRLTGCRSACFVSRIRFLLDENVDAAIAGGLKLRIPNLEIERVGLLGAPALQTPDPEILRWCEANQFILVTKNRTAMPVHLRDHLALGGHVPGILVIGEDMSL